MATLADRRSRALERIPDDHLIPPYEGEPFTTAIDAKDRVQDYAFSQEFAIVTHNYDKIRQIIVLECTQHRSHTKNWRKTPLEERKRVRFRLMSVRFDFALHKKKDENVWRIAKSCLGHILSYEP